jgi:hypothetical protein
MAGTRFCLEVAMAAMLVAAPTQAKAPTGIKGLLASASDSALTKLAVPGAFQKDEAIRIGLPGPLKKLSGVLNLAGQAGLTKGLDTALNDAAGVAAGAAKPVFRNAIDKMTIVDGVGIATGGGTAATDYLKRSSGHVLEAQLSPLVENALRKTGAFAKFQKLTASPAAASLGLSGDTLTRSVTQQTAAGIYHYMGAEERKIRANPLGIGKTLLDGV